MVINHLLTGMILQAWDWWDWCIYIYIDISTWMVDFYGINVGKYTNVPWIPMGKAKDQLILWAHRPDRVLVE